MVDNSSACSDNPGIGSEAIVPPSGCRDEYGGTLGRHAGSSARPAIEGRFPASRAVPTISGRIAGFALRRHPATHPFAASRAGQGVHGREAAGDPQSACRRERSPTPPPYERMFTVENDRSRIYGRHDCSSIKSGPESGCRLIWRRPTKGNLYVLLQVIYSRVIVRNLCSNHPETMWIPGLWKKVFRGTSVRSHPGRESSPAAWSPASERNRCPAMSLRP